MALMRCSSRPTISVSSASWFFLRQQIHERLDGHHAVLDFVRHAGRKRAEAGQPVEPPQVLLEHRRGSQAVQHDDHLRQSRAFSRAGCWRAGSSRWPRVGISRFKIGLAALGGGADQSGQRRGQRIQRRIQQLAPPSRCRCPAASAVQATMRSARARRPARRRQDIPGADSPGFRFESPPAFLPVPPVDMINIETDLTPGRSSFPVADR